MLGDPEAPDGNVSGSVTYDAARPDVLTWLQGWYATQTDGDWEHSNGITIATLDNPGWSVEIDLADTALAGQVFDRRETHRSEDDWFVAWSDNEKWDH
jgi:immunity protein 53 of polymorphic toxin system